LSGDGIGDLRSILIEMMEDIEQRAEALTTENHEAARDD
jgi:hypothetical protein